MNLRKNWLGRLIRLPRPSLTLGDRGERLAARALRRAGYRILVRSARMGLGEIDLVAEHEGTVVFVEVKTRASAQFGEPWEAVGIDKQRRVTRAAAAFLKRYRLSDHPARFDVVAITWPARWYSKPQIEHISDAFPAQGPWMA